MTSLRPGCRNEILVDGDFPDRHPERAGGLSFGCCARLRCPRSERRQGIATTRLRHQRHVQLNKLNKAGQLQYTFSAKEARHHPDDDSTDVDALHLVHFHPKRPTLTMSARTAEVSSEGETVYLRDDVRIRRDPTATRAALFGEMPDLTIQTEEETGVDEKPGKLFHAGASWLKGVGMHIDNKTQTYVLEPRASGQFESRKTKKANHEKTCDRADADRAGVSRAGGARRPRRPIGLEADRISVDDVKKVQIFEGNVVLTQGTLIIRANRIVVTQDEDGFQKGVATGGDGGLRGSSRNAKARTSTLKARPNASNTMRAARRPSSSSEPG